LDFVYLAKLSDCLKKFIRSTGFLGLEECVPEYDGISVFKSLTDIFNKVVVDDIFKVN